MLAYAAAFLPACLPACLPADKFLSWLFTAGARVIGQSPRRGAYSLVYAAGAPELDGGWAHGRGGGLLAGG
jgi:hypothetical protein